MSAGFSRRSRVASGRPSCGPAMAGAAGAAGDAGAARAFARNARVAVLAFAGSICSAFTWAQSAPAVPAPRLPTDFAWFSPPQLPGLRAAWVVGAEAESGPYLLRVALARGTRIAPHVHPDTRSSTVLSGTLYVGFGTDMNAQDMVAVPAGAVYLAPAGIPHHLWARDGDVVYQESGVGPTATAPAAR